MANKKWIVIICSIVVIGLCTGGYFWYRYRYNGCYEFYRTHHCGLAEDECTFTKVLFTSSWCN